MEVLQTIDYLIIAAYFAVILFVGIYFRGKQSSGSDYVVGGRSVPWIAVLGSIVATEVSAATFLGTPGVGFSENMNYLQWGIGSLLARFSVAFVFLGAFYSMNCFSIYEYLSKRFGSTSQYTASLYFLVTRLLASGVRLMIAATGFSLILDLPLFYCLVLFALISLLYTSIGGIRSVIYTDCVQGFVFIAAGLAVLFFLFSEIGFLQILETGKAAGRFEIINLNLSSSEGTFHALLTNPNFLPLALISGFVLTMASMGTDQDLTQRMLACKNVDESRRSLIVSGFISLPIATVFLFIGVGLYTFYQMNPDPYFPVKILDGVEVPDGNKAFPYFIQTALPAGLKGLLLVGVLAAAMSSLDSAMAALSSSAVIDLYRPLVKKEIEGNELVKVSRLLVFVFAIVLVGIAWILKDGGTFLWLSFKLSGITYSALLGVFILGALTKRGSDFGNLISMISGTILVSFLLFLSESGMIDVAWTWLIILGLTWTFSIGFCFKNDACEYLSE